MTGTTRPGDLWARRPRWLLPVALGVVVVLAIVGIIVAVVNGVSGVIASPQCTVTAPPNSPGLRASWSGSPEQMDNAATIAGVGRKLGAPDRAITIALSTAIQESGLANLSGGDRDSVGLFQQRPSQGWGTVAQLTDTVTATTKFYDALLAIPGWSTMDVTQAAQQVQRSGYPEAYADHEPEARTLALAFLGQAPGALTCSALSLSAPPQESVVKLASSELGNARLSGRQEPAAGWSIASWLVGHSTRLALDRVTYDGQTWTAASGAWAPTGPADGMLALHRVGTP
ncbi:hypothetical protein LQ327_19555 [Actinomycetospora endophytica]|uniref:Uncharacterized protein n=1 Tax=Actinomycetospora endophytica TaxID=2291215 RepID=A0ABS8PBC6_9PSEU|nr:hypothetical protein [Actinomycetospora endophytica]MCD2195570.1 hypothetical protein [Actinomycetospora endophytica]